MRRAQFENHLLFSAEIECLEMSSLAQVPNMQTVAVFSAQKKLRDDSVLDHLWCTPLARYGGVISKMPGKVVAEVLGTALHFPPAERFESVVIEGEDSA